MPVAVRIEAHTYAPPPPRPLRSVLAAAPVPSAHPHPLPDPDLKHEHMSAVVKLMHGKEGARTVNAWVQSLRSMDSPRAKGADWVREGGGDGGREKGSVCQRGGDWRLGKRWKARPGGYKPPRHPV